MEDTKPAELAEPSQEISNCKIILGFLFKNGWKIGRLDGSCSVSLLDREVTVTWASGLRCKMALQTAQEAELFAKECNAVVGRYARKTCIGNSLSLTSRCQVLDFTGRLAQFLWTHEVLESGFKRRRMVRDQSIFRLLTTSRTMLKDVILGVKERRGMMQEPTDALSFNGVVESIRDRFPREWKRLRPLQCSNTADEDRKVAKAKILQHLGCDSPPRIICTSAMK